MWLLPQFLFLFSGDGSRLRRETMLPGGGDGPRGEPPRIVPRSAPVGGAAVGPAGEVIRPRYRIVSVIQGMQGIRRRVSNSLGGTPRQASAASGATMDTSFAGRFRRYWKTRKSYGKAKDSTRQYENLQSEGFECPNCLCEHEFKGFYQFNEGRGTRAALGEDDLSPVGKLRKEKSPKSAALATTIAVTPTKKNRSFHERFFQEGEARKAVTDDDEYTPPCGLERLNRNLGVCSTSLGDQKVASTSTSGTGSGAAGSSGAVLLRNSFSEDLERGRAPHFGSPHIWGPHDHTTPDRLSTRRSPTPPDGGLPALFSAPNSVITPSCTAPLLSPEVTSSMAIPHYASGGSYLGVFCSPKEPYVKEKQEEYCFHAVCSECIDQFIHLDADKRQCPICRRPFEKAYKVNMPSVHRLLVPEYEQEVC